MNNYTLKGLLLVASLGVFSYLSDFYNTSHYTFSSEKASKKNELPSAQNYTWESLKKQHQHSPLCSHQADLTSSPAFTWENLADGLVPRAEGQSALINGKLYVFGGFIGLVEGTASELIITKTVEVYNPATATWTALAEMLHGVTHLGVATDGDEVWLCGGFEGNNPGVITDKVQIYNTTTNTWRYGPDLPEPMASHAVARLGRKIHVFGGLKPNRQTDNTAHYALDLDNQVAGWQALAPLPNPRNHHAGKSANGKLYAIGGQYGHDSSYDDVNLVHAYDPFTNSWQRVADLPYTRSHFEHSTLLTLDGKIIIIGGRRENMAGTSDDAITEYDPVANTWTELEKLPRRLLAPNAGIIEDELYVSHGGAMWQQPLQGVYKTDFVRTPLNQLGFQSTQINVTVARGSSLAKEVYLWASNDAPNYTIPTANLPNWLSVNNPTGTTNTEAQEISLNFDASNLAVGSYNFTLQANAQDFSQAEINITLDVVEQTTKVLYIYGNVNRFGYLPSQPEYANEPVPYDQMRLNDTGDNGMSEFKAAIEAIDFEIEEAYDQDITLTEEFLTAYDVIILASNQKTWAASEVAALNVWVRNGGGLIGYSDSGFGGIFNQPLPAGLNNQQGRNSNNLLMQQFGMFFFTDQGGGGGDNLVTDWELDHFLNTKDGIPQTLQFRGEGCSPIRIDPDWAEKQACDTIYQIARFQNGGVGGPTAINDPVLGNGIQDYDIDCSLAAAEIGNGRVIGTFDRNTFWNNGPGTDIDEHDNRIFSQKLVQWAAQRTLSPAQVTVSGERKTWHKVSITFEGPQTSETAANNPFLNYRLDVTFTNGSKTYKVPGFYAADGDAAETSAAAGNKWRVHFAPDEVGLWEYTVSFRSGENIAVSEEACAGIANYFDGLEGSFMIAQSDKQGKDLRAYGRLRYVGEHYLQFPNGKRFLKVGADAPETFLAYADFDDTYRHATRADDFNRIKTWTPHIADWQAGDPTWQGNKGKGMIGAINYLSQKGNNAFSFLTYNAGGDGQNVWPFIAHDDKFHYDCSKLDQWEIVFEHADQKGMYLHFKTQETENDDNNVWALDNGNLGIERKLYYRELIARFSHHLALNWNLGEENTQTTAQRQQMAQYFYDNDPYRNHVVLHTYPNQIEQVYTPLLGTNSELTGVSLQTPFNNVHQETLKWVINSKNANKPWVVANDEQGPFQRGVPPDEGYQGFSNGANTPSQGDIRKYTLWGNLMAGGAGVEYYFGYNLIENDLDCEDWRSRDQMWDYNRHALEFFYDNSIPFWEMETRNDLIDNAANSNTKYCLSKPGEIYVIYLPNGGTTDLNLEGFANNFTIEWYNPRTGGLLETGSVTMATGAGVVNVGNPPADATEDWVVLLVNESTPLSLPPNVPIEEILDERQGLKIYPNPAKEYFTVKYDRNNGGVEPQVMIYNGLMQRIGSPKIAWNGESWEALINLTELKASTGIYFVAFKTKNQTIYKKIIIE